jgi:hypothetical protein
MTVFELLIVMRNFLYLAMRIQRATAVNELLAKALFLLAPTLLVCYFLIWNANQYYTILNNQTLQQSLYVAAGMAGAALVYGFRFRFLPTFALLSLGLYLVYKGIDATAIGEFDTFFLSIQFRVFSITFLLGWIIGWGFTRLRFFSIFIAALFLVACISLIARRNELFFSNEENGLWSFINVFAPAVLYAVYIIFTAELIHNYKDKSQKFWWFLTRRLALFCLVSILLLGGVIYLMRGEISETIAQYGGGGEAGKNSMLKKNKDNTFDLQQYTRLRGSLGRSNELLFAAHIDNFLPGTELPNPLYLTAFYYSRFDTLTETFEKDPNIPLSDLFEPDPSQIPVFFTKYDSSVLDYALQEKLRRTVEIEIYKKQLSASTFIAPSTSFFVQPITVEKDFREEFKSAYRAKSYISELNSAYFVYNAGDNEEINKFQQQRFEVLRSVQHFNGVDRRLMDYYTYMPSDAKFNRIKALAAQIAGDKPTPIDKVLAIRDYFLSKDENGEALFSYTDNPGVPDIPDASKLQYFLFENRKGYCAYYAGATLFLLRSLGIPSRITVGFMTVDRSNKNKGWYWYYADQAHAWVQVYFPGFGWLDFDTTVGNEEAEQSPAPDGTPPMQPPKAYLAGDGLITHIDTLRKKAGLRMSRMVYHDQEFRFEKGAEMELDLSIAAIRKDSVDVPLSELQKGDSATAVSYAEAYKHLKPAQGEPAGRLLNRLPQPAPIDEVHIKPKPHEAGTEAVQQQPEAGKTNWKAILLASLFSVVFILLLLLSFPRLLYAYFRARYRWSGSWEAKAYWAYRTAGYYLHQLGYQLAPGQTMWQYAEQTDAQLQTNFAPFMVPYLKLKYAGQALSESEKAILTSFLSGFLRNVQQAIPWKKRFTDFFRLFRAIGYLGLGPVNNRTA